MIRWFRLMRISQLAGVVGLYYDRWRHVRRGSTYRRLNVARLQISGRQLEEGDALVIYECERGGDWYARLEEDFHDGRFERC